MSRRRFPADDSKCLICEVERSISLRAVHQISSQLTDIEGDDSESLMFLATCLSSSGGFDRI